MFELKLCEEQTKLFEDTFFAFLLEHEGENKQSTLHVRRKRFVCIYSREIENFICIKCLIIFNEF